MTFFFHPEAEQEFVAAVEWYEERSEGLGLDFATEIRQAISRAESMPLTWTEIAEDIRRVLVHRFPYGVLYSPSAHDIQIVAVMHLSRTPGYWQHRTATK